MVYGEALVPDGRAVWDDECLAPRPREAYDETKPAAEALVARSAVPAVTLRIARGFPGPLEILARHRTASTTASRSSTSRPQRRSLSPVAPLPGHRRRLHSASMAPFPSVGGELGVPIPNRKPPVRHW